MTQHEAASGQITNEEAIRLQEAATLLREYICWDVTGYTGEMADFLDSLGQRLQKAIKP